MAQRIASYPHNWIRQEVYQDMMHVFHVFRFLKTAQVAFKRLIAFINGDRDGRGMRLLMDPDGEEMKREFLEKSSLDLERQNVKNRL